MAYDFCMYFDYPTCEKVLKLYWIWFIGLSKWLSHKVLAHNLCSLKSILFAVGNRTGHSINEKLLHINLNDLS